MPITLGDGLPEDHPLFAEDAVFFGSVIRAPDRRHVNPAWEPVDRAARLRPKLEWRRPVGDEQWKTTDGRFHLSRAGTRDEPEWNAYEGDDYVCSAPTKRTCILLLEACLASRRVETSLASRRSHLDLGTADQREYDSGYRKGWQSARWLAPEDLPEVEKTRWDEGFRAGHSDARAADDGSG
jgi:hypothetical protein